MSRAAPWTESETQRLEAMAATGQSAADIGAAIGRAPHAVRAKAQRMGLEFAVPMGRPRKLDYAEIGRLADAGWRRFEVAQIYGRSAERVYDLVKR